jgi:hypothetical protein
MLPCRCPDQNQNSVEKGHLLWVKAFLDVGKRADSRNPATSRAIRRKKYQNTPRTTSRPGVPLILIVALESETTENSYILTEGMGQSTLPVTTSQPEIYCKSSAVWRQQQ